MIKGIKAGSSDSSLPSQESSLLRCPHEELCEAAQIIAELCEAAQIIAAHTLEYAQIMNENGWTIALTTGKLTE